MHTQEQRMSGSRNALGLKAFDHHLVECAIWDLMADFKKRNVHEICHAIKLQGYCGVTVDKRTKVLLARKWFDRSSERGGSPYYTLKKSVKRPLPKGIESIEVAAKKAVGRPASTAGFLATALQSIDMSKENVHAEYRTPTDFHVQAVLDTIVISSKPEPVDRTVLPHDPIQIAIWKVTADHRPYTVQRLVAAIPGVPQATITGNLTKMVKSGLILVNRLDKSLTKTYTLKVGTPMPIGLKPYEPAAWQAKPTVNTQLNLAVETPQKKETMLATIETFATKPLASLTDAITASTAINTQVGSFVADPKLETFEIKDSTYVPLLDFGIRIKGQQVTMQEAQTIAVELMEAGFGDSDAEPVPPPHFKMIEVMVRIRGMEFTLAEANLLASELIRNKFHS